jgi:type I restriction enzyme S subunit
MEVNTGYRQTEVGEIPNDWDVKPLWQLGESLIGLTYKPQDVCEHGTLVLRSSNIQEDSLRFEDNVFVQKDIPERLMVRPGDILICVRNGSRDLIGKSVLLDERANGMTFGAFMTVFRSPRGWFVSYLFQSEILKRQINEHLGATINQITNKSLNSFEIPLPPNESEQDAIAAALSDVDALLDALDRLIAKKRDLKQAAMRQLLTGQSRLPGFTCGWKLKRLGEVAIFLKGRGLPKSELIPFGSDQCIHYGELFTQYHETIREITSRTNGKRDAFRSVANDVLMPTSDVTPRGLAKASCVIVDGVILGGDILVVRLDISRVFGPFLSYVIRREENQVLQLVTGSTVYHLYGSDMDRFAFSLPSLPEQAAIVAALSDMDAELEALEHRLAKTRDLKQAMMQELLTGKTRLIPQEHSHA